MLPAVRSPSALRLPGRVLSFFCAAACLLGALSIHSYAEGAHLFGFGPTSPFEHAERLRKKLEEQPRAALTRRDYERVLDAYRLIYHDNPASPEAAASIDTVAVLLAEEGRLFHSETLLCDAVAQYEFLRREYPGSSYRFSALIAEGEIYRLDLNDPGQAKAKFQQFLISYPRNPLAAQARIEIRGIHQEEIAGRRKEHPVVPDPTLPSTASDYSSAPDYSRNAESPLPLPAPSPAAAIENPIPRHGRLPRVTRIRYWVTGGYTRIAVDLDDQAPYRAARVAGPDRIYFDLSNTRLSPELMGKSVTVTGDRFLQRIRAAQYSNDVTRIVLDIGSATDYSAFFLPNPWRLIIDIHGRKDGAPALEESASLSSGSSRPSSGPVSGPVSPHRPLSPPSPLPPSRNELESLENLSSPLPPSPGPASSPASSMVRQTSALTLQPDRPRSVKRLKSEPPSAIDLPAIREAEPTADGERSMVRTLGLKIGRIVLDAGHGGHDCGTVGPGGVQEKDIVLDVTLRLGKLLRRRLGADVIYTRGDDTFIPLETRTAIANKSRADLFISIHANSSSDPAARGVESYYLNFTTSPDALEVAARENAVSDASIHELSDLVKKIALRSKIEESREFATDVQSSLYDGLEAGNPGLKDRGVKKAPFVVLIGANMPSILAEISFLTNPDDARELTPARLSRAHRRVALSRHRQIH